MTTIKDSMELAFMAGKNAGRTEARNIYNETQEPVKTLGDLIKGIYFELFDLETGVEIKDINI